jgi:site-specific recombinase XerD
MMVNINGRNYNIAKRQGDSNEFVVDTSSVHKYYSFVVSANYDTEDKRMMLEAFKADMADLIEILSDKNDKELNQWFESDDEDSLSLRID